MPSSKQVNSGNLILLFLTLVRFFIMIPPLKDFFIIVFIDIDYNMEYILFQEIF